MTDVTGVGIRNLLAGNLRKSAGIMRFGNGLPRQSVPQGHLLRGAHWGALKGKANEDVSFDDISLVNGWYADLLCQHLDIPVAFRDTFW